jgi:transposase InsO family protein
MRHYREQLLACDFFNIETIWLKTLTVFFFIDIGSRQVYLAGITDHPNCLWITQQARNQVWTIQEQANEYYGLIRDNDKKYPKAFDTVFESEGINIIRIPYQAPNANAFAERFVRTVREEILDKILILNEAHLHRVLTEFLDYYNTRRPHQGLEQQSPIERAEPLTEGLIQRRKVLGGIINDYFRMPPLKTAAQPA